MTNTPCNCVADFNERLKNYNTRIIEGLIRIDDSWVTRPMIASEQIETGRGKKKPAKVVPSFCPFCGNPYLAKPAGALSDVPPSPREKCLLEALHVAKRAILEAAQDTLWCVDVPAETVIDRIDAVIAGGEPGRDAS